MSTTSRLGKVVKPVQSSDAAGSDHKPKVLQMKPRRKSTYRPGHIVDEHGSLVSTDLLDEEDRPHQVHAGTGVDSGRRNYSHPNKFQQIVGKFRGKRGVVAPPLPIARLQCPLCHRYLNVAAIQAHLEMKHPRADIPAILERLGLPARRQSAPGSNAEKTIARSKATAHVVASKKDAPGTATAPERNGTPAVPLRKKVVPCPICSVQISLQLAPVHIRFRHPEAEMEAVKDQLFGLYGDLFPDLRERWK